MLGCGVKWESNPCTALRAPGDRHLPAGGLRAGLRDNYLRHLGSSVQQVYLPVEALNSHIKLAKFAGEIIRACP